MPNPIEWREADRTETKTIPGASARLVVRRRWNPRGIVEMDDATPADLASALGAIPATERAAILQAFGADPEMRAALLADCAVAHGRAAVSEAVANETRKARVAAEAERDAAHAERDDARNELRALEWLAAKGCASRPVFVGRDGHPFAYASYAGAARALGWEG